MSHIQPACDHVHPSNRRRLVLFGGRICRRDLPCGGPTHLGRCLTCGRPATITLHSTVQHEGRLV